MKIKTTIKSGEILRKVCELMTPSRPRDIIKPFYRESYLVLSWALKGKVLSEQNELF